MNPEEGELRPQLLDRFGLCCEVAGISDPDERMEVVRRRVAFEEDPAGFYENWQPEEEKLTTEISRARELLAEVSLADSMLKRIVTLSIELQVDGHRGDIVMVKTAKALAALHGLSEVGPEEVQEAAELVLPHRMRRNPFDAIGLDRGRVEDVLAN
jgi:Mg-chelatase subunit ChlI